MWFSRQEQWSELPRYSSGHLCNPGIEPESPALQADSAQGICAARKPNLSIRSDQISRSVMSDSLRPHESQHTRPPCPSPTHGVHWDSYPSSQWCHSAISSSVIPFSSCPQSLKLLCSSLNNKCFLPYYALPDFLFFNFILFLNFT